MVVKTDWDLSPLLMNDDDPQQEKELKRIEHFSNSFVQKWKDRHDYLDNPEILKEALEEYEEFFRKYGPGGKTGYYLALKFSLDQTNTNIKAKANKLEEFSKKIQNQMQFFSLRLSKISIEKQGEFLNFKGLENYRHYLEKIFLNAKYLLSEQEEKILNLKESVAHMQWEDMTSTLLTKQEREVILDDGSKVIKNFSEIISLMDSHNKKTRDFAKRVFEEIIDKYVEVAEFEMNAIMMNKKIDDNLRNIYRPDLVRHLDDDLDSRVVDILLDSVSKRFDISKRFYELKAKLMKVDKLNYSERNVSYGSSKNYNYDDATNLVFNALNKLDSKFGRIFGFYLKSGQIDVYPKKGKRGGAFCTHGTLLDPTYILLNFNGKLRDITTLAHEVGHGINNELMKEAQNSLNFGTPKSTAEVASTFMEDFVLQEILRECDEEAKLGIMLDKLNDDISTIFRQVAFYKFEQEIHASFREIGYLSKEQIGEIFKKHIGSYLGNFVDISNAGNWWIYIPHFRSMFYVYSYSSGLLISKTLQNEVKKDPLFIEKVKEFLSAGTSDSPKSIFAKLGIDIASEEFWNKGLKEIDELLKETENLAKKLGKI